jgi:putative Ca2+/H+ antiporter (TMEM165/GDT1 family)
VTIFSSKLNRVAIFIFGSAVMILMHVLSVLIGSAFPLLLSRLTTEIVCVVLFLGFGLYMVYQSLFEEEAHVWNYKSLLTRHLNLIKHIGKRRREKRDH